MLATRITLEFSTKPETRREVQKGVQMFRLGPTFIINEYTYNEYIKYYKTISKKFAVRQVLFLPMKARQAATTRKQRKSKENSAPLSILHSVLC